MLTILPQYIKDANGEKSLMAFPAEEFESLMDELEELEDIRLYDEAKKEDTGERILFSDYLKTGSRTMANYTIVLSKKTQKQLDKLTDLIAAPILDTITRLGKNPRPVGCKS